jgi:hypothetical protein
VLPPNGKPSFIWKFFGAMFMEDKGGVQAVSLHRVFTCIIGVVVIVWWVAAPGRAMPEELLYTFWGLLGITGGTKIIETVKGQPAATPGGEQ